MHLQVYSTYQKEFDISKTGLTNVSVVCILHVAL